MTEWTEDYNVNDLGFTVGAIVALNSQKNARRKKRGPLGFAVTELRPRKPRGRRRPGDWPDVPRFDVL